MKGIILAGGSGTRLYPVTYSVSKQLLAVYDKPMIYYPMSILMLAGIKDILLIVNRDYIDNFKVLFGNGEKFGISIEYKIQENPNGLPEAFIIGEEFIGDDDVCLILGDNIFFGHDIVHKHLISSIKKATPTIFAYYVNEPNRYGVVEFDKNFNVISVEEKPEKAKSNYAITGLYLFDNEVVNSAKSLTPSKRGELEIVDIIRNYVDKSHLRVEIMGRGIAWFDTGTHRSLLDASRFVETIENRQGLKIACLEEIAYKQGFISKKQLEKLIKPLVKTDYGKYLRRILDEEI